MKENRFYTGVVQKVSNTNHWKIYFHDFKELSNAIENDIEDAIRAAGRNLAVHLQKHLGPDPTPPYRIPKQPDEHNRILYSVELDADKMGAKYTGYLLVSCDESKQEGLWDNPYNMSDNMMSGINSSDEFRSFHFFRRLMNITNEVKDVIHDEMQMKYSRKANVSSSFRWIKTKFRAFFDPNWKISVDVFNRLLLRYTILRDVEKLEERYGAQRSMSQNQLCDSSSMPNNTTGKYVPFVAGRSVDKISDNNSSKGFSPDMQLRPYRLATTDVFVEKAIAYLELDSNKYRRRGVVMFMLATATIAVGMLTSYKNFISVSELPAKMEWSHIFMRFSSAFTFYGMIVLLAVGLWRLGKAMLDQAERLLDRRHALRQGRLFVHLNDGMLNLDELEKAFSWNVTNGNAFEYIQTEASAPWGGLFKDALKAVSDTFGKKSDK